MTRDAWRTTPTSLHVCINSMLFFAVRHASTVLFEHNKHGVHMCNGYSLQDDLCSYAAMGDTSGNGLPRGRLAEPCAPAVA